MDPTHRWYHHPFVVFFIPLVVLIFSPHVYTFLNSQSWTLPHRDDEIQQIATLLDEVYTMLAEMTFIPHTSIKRGPHNINTASIPCKRDPAVVRLMRQMPYIDPLEMSGLDWTFHANILDYRRLDHLHEGCDPLDSGNGGDYLKPQTIALMNWGDPDYRQAVLTYDTYRHAMRVQHNVPEDVDPELQWPGSVQEELFREAMRHHDLPTSTFLHYLWGTFFEAPTLLKMLKEALRSPIVSPWEVFDHDNDLGLEEGVVTKILHGNGWPDSFSPEGFNVELIRTRHRAKQMEEREIALGRRDELLQDLYTYDGEEYSEDDNSINGRFAMLEEELAKTTDEQQQWVTRWQLQREIWDLANDRAELEEVEKVVEKVCPADDCRYGKDIILWEYRAVEREYLKSQDMPNAQSKCRTQLDSLPEWAPPDPHRFSNCVAQRNLKQHWLFVAYTQSKAAALEFCAGDKLCLLRSSTIENLAEAKITALNRDINVDEDRLKKMAAWAQSLPPHATKAATRFAQDESGIVERLRYNRARAEWIEEQLAGGEKLKLWECFDNYECR